MCTNPILIRNRKYRHLDVNLKSSYIKVPCGQCDECLRSRANDLYVRARYEYDDCLKAGGCGFMVCLTYGLNLCPYFEFEGKKYKVFRKSDVIYFIKRLRTNLDRYFMRYYNRKAPDFKYLFTSEFGTSKDGHHLPHYHGNIFFREPISYRAFRTCFIKSLNKKVGKELVPVFGKIFQCDLIDPRKGGIKYTAKYILKDQMYLNQSELIKKEIKFAKDYVDTIFNINSLPITAAEEFKNKCIRTSKKYRKAVADYVRPYRHMLQFYMLSNDLGISAIIRKYGENVVNMPILNFNGFPFALPKLVRKRLEAGCGTKKFDECTKQIFINYVSRALDDLVTNFKLSNDERSFFLDFANTFIYPCFGYYYLVNPFGVNIREHLDSGSGLQDWDLIINDFNFFDDNDLFETRNKFLNLLSLYDSEDNRFFRASVAHRKTEQERIQYETKKRNNSYKY